MTAAPAAITIPDPAVCPTISPEEAFRLLGYGRTAGYERIRQGDFPVPVLRNGRVIRIPTARVLAVLGLHAAPQAPGND